MINRIYKHFMGINKKISEWVDSWHASPVTNKNYDFIDGIRGIAILMVVACHLIYENRTANPLVTFFYKIVASGTNGVTIFFVLSGFLISWPFWKNKARNSSNVFPRGYAWRRFYKIYPALAISLLLLTPVYVWFSGDHTYYSTAAKYLAGIPLFHSVRGNLNPVMWSLIVEVQFYLMLPVIFFSLSRVSFRSSLWIIFLSFALIPLAFRIHHHVHGMEFSLHPMIELRFPSMFDAFAPGILMAGLVASSSLPKQAASWGKWGELLLIVSLLFTAFLKMEPRSGVSFALRELSSVGFKLSAFLLLAYISDPARLGARILAWSPLRWFGIISYEWYLFHQAIYGWIWREGFGMAEGNVTKYLLTILTSGIAGLFFSAIIYRYFSLPILRFGRQRHAT